mmetsp:Transcript_36852/g.49351  ORF Transcript_36852/g.49351 Transcript_36852/m.49351 type:complete len:432 (+) Transcript_36852:53-1348(+)
MSSANFSSSTVNHRRPHKKASGAMESADTTAIETLTEGANVGLGVGVAVAIPSSPSASPGIYKRKKKIESLEISSATEHMEHGRLIPNTVSGGGDSNGKRTIAVGVVASSSNAKESSSSANTSSSAHDEESGVIVFHKEGADDAEDDEHEHLFDEIKFNDTNEDEEDDEDDDVDADLDRLLGESTTGKKENNQRRKKQQTQKYPNCCYRYCVPAKPYYIGDTTVLCPSLYRRYGLGVVGPHWPGTLCTFGILWGASYFYTKKAYEDDSLGNITLGICCFFTLWSTISLCRVAFKDPGVVTRERQQNMVDGRDLTNWRYCDICSVYQPPDAAHCPDCNVCVEGYDHHCPWMGQCIGKKNMSAFVTFNFSWLLYLVYAILWVTIMGPTLGGNSVHGDGADHGDSSSNETDIINVHNDTNATDTAWNNSSSFGG